MQHRSLVERMRHARLMWIVVGLLVGLLFGQASQAAAPDCTKLGWFPEGFGLKDHTVFHYAGYHYLMAIEVIEGDNDPYSQDQFAYARTTDFCNWEVLAPVLPERVPGALDETAIWAPHVFEENGIFYLFYTGVDAYLTQRILLATSADPADSTSWQRQDFVFTPEHTGSLWQAGQDSDCRDAFVQHSEAGYEMIYSTRDADGWIIGAAYAADLSGPWEDTGRMFAADANQPLESPALAEYDGHQFLFYNLSGLGEVYRWRLSEAANWSEETRLRPGWAHEVWQDQQSVWHTSYLTNYTVTVKPLLWREYSRPALPWIGGHFYPIFIPLTARNSYNPW